MCHTKNIKTCIPNLSSYPRTIKAKAIKKTECYWAIVIVVTINYTQVKRILHVLSCPDRICSECGNDNSFNRSREQFQLKQQ